MVVAYRIDSPNHRAFMERIRERRVELGLTQAEVAERLGISTPSYNAIEAGKNTPTVERMESVAAALGMTLSVELAPTSNKR